MKITHRSIGLNTNLTLCSGSIFVILFSSSTLRSLCDEGQRVTECNVFVFSAFYCAGHEEKIIFSAEQHHILNETMSNHNVLSSIVDFALAFI